MNKKYRSDYYGIDHWEEGKSLIRTQRCENCVHWAGDDDTRNDECRVNPPKESKDELRIFPFTYKDDWCGKWEAIPKGLWIVEE